MTARSRSETLVAVDGTALAYRAHFAFADRPLTNREGEVTSAVFGFILALRRVLDALKPDRLVVVFDPPGPTFRHEMYTEYKAQRERMPPDLKSQLPRIREWLDASGIAWLAVPGFEADDALASVARHAVDEGLRVLIVSNDKDLLQLVREGLSVVQLGRASEPPKVLDEAGVRDAFGVEPARMVDLLSMTGDSSDNVPGIPGVGVKTAAKLLEEHGTLDAVLAAAPSMKPGKLRDGLLAHREKVAFSRRLVELRSDVEVPESETFRPRAADADALRALLDALDFQSLRKDVAPATSVLEPAGYATIEDDAALERLVARLRAADRFAIGAIPATTGGRRADPVGLAICDAPGRAAFVPIGHATDRKPSRAAIARLLVPLLGETRPAKWAHDAKTVAVAASRLGADLGGVDFDTMLASYVLDASRGGHGLAELARERLRITLTPPESATGSGRERVAWEEAPGEAVARVACEEVDAAFRLRALLEPEIDVHDAAGVLRSLELPLLPVLERMERAGVRLDLPFLAALSQRMEEELSRITGEAWRCAGENFNPASPKQVAELLFGKLGLKPRGRTKTGLSTNAAILEELADDHEVVRCILRHRELSKLKSTYVDALPALVDPATRRVHTTFQQAVAATGRLSSADPNLQNVPIRTWEGREIRKAFVPSREGWRIVSCDYSQIELRLLAHMAQDQALLQAFRDDLDVHRATAARIFDVSVESVTPEQRSQAKTINYAVTYGMGAVNLGKSLGISTKEASGFIRSYFERLPGVLEWIERTQRRAREDLVVETLSGRKRAVPEIASPDPRTRAFGERIAVNTPIQGSAADILKRAMIRVDAELAGAKLEARMILTVHDELVFDCPAGEEAEVIERARRAMEGAADLDVPLRVDAGAGANWAEAH